MLKIQIALNIFAKVFWTRTSEKITKQYDNKDKSSSKGSTKEVEEYIVHPNLLKFLKTGETYCKIQLNINGHYLDKLPIVENKEK